ncbi:MAG: SbcC/MukB-like Walker B domain-containing protein, partial [Alkalispirochaetaceae bacterium]
VLPSSLALALGLSDTVQAELGGLNLEVIFIDEGFGSLDEEALEEALNTLDELTGSGRSVGIISHVAEVKRRVPAGFQVESTLRGSRIVSRGGGGG